jgi:hypothetical protein
MTLLHLKSKWKIMELTSAADPGFGAFITPGSGIQIRDDFFPYTGSILTKTKTLLLIAQEARKN